MRNLKRALSLALASVMLLGMMVTGAGAASNSFTDFDQIVNQEAAEVTSGLGIFDGYTDGSFGPENVVTRAEMAVIICKILNGSDVDPGNFTGISHFTDVPSWAEGYVNYCASMNIVVGVGDGKFNPNGTVTTVEATTMLLKALGYFVDENDQLGADWKTTVTGRATYLTLYGALTLNANEGLTRDNVAELVFHTILSQRVAYDDNRNLYVKNTNRQEVVTNGTEDWDNTLAEDTFGMWIVDGVVTANSCTEDSLSEAVNNAPRTDVLFDEAAQQDYPARSYQDAGASHYPFEYTTGLDMIGHAARVYYKMERNAPVVFAIVDRATKVEYITYNSNTTLLANAANDAGFRRNTILQIAKEDYKVNYDWDNTVGELAKTENTINDRHVNLTGPSVAKTLIVISNSSDSTVDCVIVLDQYLDTVRRVAQTTDGKTEYKLTTHDGSDQNVPHDTFAEKDYVVVTDIGNQGEMFNLTAPEKVTANITKITGVSDGSATVKSITADGTEYKGSPAAHHEDAKQELTDSTRTLEDTTNFESIQTIGEATLLLDFQGKCIGLAEPETVNNYAYAAQFGVGHKNGSLNTEYGLTVKLFFIDGTSGVYNVNTSSGSTATNTFKGLKMYIHGGEQDALAVAKMLNNGLKNHSGNYPYVVANNNTNKATYDPQDTYTKDFGVNANGHLTGIVDDTTTGLGVYRVSLRSDNSVVLRALSVDQAKQVTNGTRLVPGHSTLIQGNGQNVKQDTGRDMYQTEKTAYFYVDGGVATAADGTPIYDGDTLHVGVRTGVSKAAGFTVGKDVDTNGRDETIEQLFVTRAARTTERDTVSAMMVYGYDLGYSDDLYFYKEGNYDIIGRSDSRANDSMVYIVYHMYDANGEVKDVTYNNSGKYYDIEVAREMVADHATGYYELGGDDIEEKYVVVRGGGNGAVNGADPAKCEFNVRLTDSAKYHPDKTPNVLQDAHNVYVINANAHHREFVDNIYTEVDEVGGISGSVLVVDATGNGIDSVRAIADKDLAGDTVRISYTYKTTGDDSYKVKVIFVTGYEPKGTNVTVTAGDPSKAVIDDVRGIITLDAVDNTLAMNQLYNALTVAGLYNVGGVNFNGSSNNTVAANTAAGTTIGSVLTSSINGNKYRSYSIVMGTNYITLKVDGAVAQYVPYNTDSKVIDFTKTSHKGGTGYIFTVPTGGNVTFVDGTAQAVKTHVKYDTAVKAIKMISSVALETGYVKVDGAPGGITYAKYNTALTLNGTAGQTYSYTVNGQNKTVDGKGTIPATDMIADITLSNISANVFTIDGTPYTLAEMQAAKDYVASKNTVGTGLWKDGATTGTAESNEYMTYAEFAASTPAVNDVYYTGYVKAKVDSSDKIPVKLNDSYTVTAPADDAGTGYSCVVGTAGEVYRTYATPIVATGDFTVETKKVTLKVNGVSTNVIIDEAGGTWKPSDIDSLRGAISTTVNAWYKAPGADLETRISTNELNNTFTATHWVTDIAVATRNVVTTDGVGDGVVDDLFDESGNPSAPGDSIDTNNPPGSHDETDTTAGDNMTIHWTGEAGKYYRVVIYEGTQRSEDTALWAGDKAGTAGVMGIYVCLNSRAADKVNPNAGGGWLAGADYKGAAHLEVQDRTKSHNLTAGYYMYEVLEYAGNPTNQGISGYSKIVVSKTFSFTPSDM